MHVPAARHCEARLLAAAVLLPHQHQATFAVVEWLIAWVALICTIPLPMTIDICYTALLLSGCAPGAPACVDSSTQFFGAPWDASLVDAEQESDYKLWGDLVGAAVLYNKETGCVQAVQGTYGPEVPSTSTLGLKARGSSVLREELTLEAGEVIDYVEYKAHR
jgi:hypothetical protein